MERTLGFLNEELHEKKFYKSLQLAYTEMESYIPSNTKEMETLCYIAVLAQLEIQGSLYTETGLQEHGQRYLHSKFGKDPHDRNVPLFFKERFGKEALSFRNWQAVSLLHTSKQYKELEGNLYKSVLDVLRDLHGANTTSELYYSTVELVRNLPRSPSAHL